MAALDHVISSKPALKWPNVWVRIFENAPMVKKLQKKIVTIIIIIFDCGLITH